MDANAKKLLEIRINKVIANLEKNNMSGIYAHNAKSAAQEVQKLLCDGDTVSVGGSMTLFETGIIDLLRSGSYKFLDRYQQGLGPDDIMNIYRQSFCADAYLVSSNAITENGELYNVDGNSNRVAAMLFGPKKVIVVAGYNKIVHNIDEAITRVKTKAAPANSNTTTLQPAANNIFPVYAKLFEYIK